MIDTTSLVWSQPSWSLASVMFCSVVEEVSGETVSHQAEGMEATFTVTANPQPEGETRAR